MQTLCTFPCRKHLYFTFLLLFQTPTTVRGWKDIAEGFDDNWQLPHCIGSLDGKHIRIMRPYKSGSTYYNYKHFYSIILMAIVDSDYNFIYVQVGAEGRNNDGGVYLSSHIKKYLDMAGNPLNIPEPSPVAGCEGRLPYYFCADDAFRLNYTTMKPYGGHGLPREEQIFNKRLSRGRRTVENAFGIMAMRFRILLHCIENQPRNATIMTTAICVLHNFLRRKSPEIYMPSGSYDEQLPDNQYVPGTWRQDATLTELKRMSGANATWYARNMRERLTRFFVSRQGRMSWQ